MSHICPLCESSPAQNTFPVVCNRMITSSMWHSVFTLTVMLYFLHFAVSAVCVSELESGAERAHHIQQITVTLPRTVIIVMRYLFAFLNQ